MPRTGVPASNLVVLGLVLMATGASVVIAVRNPRRT
ncbi:MAG TPA: LPXTG cell wall anchor domain-containing protein [Acidimicrobiales bacterium]|nr:LPXTG cell wall anchor domain-containing protein [Acidimicrobiales bacterium]